MHCNEECIDGMHVHYMEAAVAPTECKKILKAKEPKSKQVDQTLDYVLKTGFAAI